jgi:hypothetical protein
MLENKIIEFVGEICRVWLCSDLIIIAKGNDSNCKSCTLIGKYPLEFCICELSPNSPSVLILSLPPAIFTFQFETQGLCSQWMSKLSTAIEVCTAELEDVLDDEKNSDDYSKSSSNNFSSVASFLREVFDVYIVDLQSDTTQTQRSSIVQLANSLLIIQDSKDALDRKEIQLDQFMIDDCTEVSHSFIVSRLTNILPSIEFEVSTVFVLYDSKQAFVFKSSSIWIKKDWAGVLRRSMTKSELVHKTTELGDDVNVLSSKSFAEVSPNPDMKHCVFCKKSFGFTRRRHTCKKW